MPRDVSAGKRRQKHQSNAGDDQAQSGQRRESGESTTGSLLGNPQAQDLKFVEVTEESLQGLHNADEQKSIRAHVMRDFHRQRSSGGPNAGPNEGSQPVSMAEDLSQHITRFRLPNAKPRKKQSESRQPRGGGPEFLEMAKDRELLPKCKSASAILID